MKKLRIEIQRETLKYIDHHQYQFKSQTKKYPNCSYPSKIKNLFQTAIEVVPLDTLEAVIHFQSLNAKKYAFLVMANGLNPGGGYKEGSPAQEESICRRTNLVTCLLIQKYPIPEFGGIYIKDLHILRDTEHNKYVFLPKPILSNCLLCAAYSNPTTTKDNKLDQKFREGTRKKIETMLNILLENGETHIILGAWGCGAFANPAEDMAYLFKEILTSNAYNGRFQHVVFAIIKDSWHNNLKIFTDIFSKN